MKHVLFLLLAFITIPAWGTVNEDKKEEEIKPDKSFELELWTWDSLRTIKTGLCFSLLRHIWMGLNLPLPFLMQ